MRYGRVLTKAHGLGPLRGRFEWAADVLPIAEVSQPGRRVYGAGFDPVVWKWNFVTRRGLSPYWEFSGGGLFSNQQEVAGRMRTQNVFSITILAPCVRSARSTICPRNKPKLPCRKSSIT